MHHNSSLTSLFSIVVPTYNGSANLANFLESFTKSEYTNFEIIINDDQRTDDNTPEIIKKYSDTLKILYLRENVSMAQARKKGASYAQGDILIHLDSDMKVAPGLLGEIVELMNEYDALIIHEESFGIGFWAQCKWLEKKCYRGLREIESLRVIKKDIYDQLGGHDERMVFSEDKDFDIRVQESGYKIGYVKENYIFHNEGELKLSKTLKKKKGYSHTANIFAEKHPQAYRRQINIFNRYWIYLKNIKYLFQYPKLYIGMIYMKTMEFASGAIGLLTS